MLFISLLIIELTITSNYLYEDSKYTFYKRQYVKMKTRLRNAIEVEKIYNDIKILLL